jgi:adenylate kinase family enzyme
MRFQKILITGNAGSGKTTLSKKIGRILNIQPDNLDRIVWLEGWQKTPQDKRDQQIDGLIEKDTWVIDGVSPRVLSRADLVIFLDLPRSTCYWRALQRTVRHAIHQRPEIPAHSPELLIVPKLIKIIWRFPNLVRPGILAEKDKRDGHTFRHIRSQRDLAELIDSFEKK